MRVLPFGDRALLAEYDSLEVTMAAARQLEASAPAGVVELVPAARTVLVRVEPGVSLRRVETWMREVGDPAPAAAASGAPLVTIPVRYDGPDLAEAAAAVGLTAGALAERHAASAWVCAFTGFAPGFGYLVSPDFGLELPRRATSRPRVEPGSVALAAEFSGVYPRASPGGWQLIGSTDAVLFDPEREPAALLRPGTRVRFEARP
ncbi:allophanate hydrolase subunit 1 [uncultured Schumannella sp.]|uniref:5-oxoprolinase subunit B family protein n=1 Tax=uncultured Schumannella sp. TaxID=1195956 RepID=UPI0025D13192|nr:allophanate hydrolase subunit 1 [uncultured Schumannella sp.]